MGIRYYAYAFDAELTEQALHDPNSILSSDPLADAWGLEPHAGISVASFEQVSPERDMLYLDKAWSALQWLTAGSGDEPGAAYRMFEGAVAYRGDGGWDAFVRTVQPDEMPAIRDALLELKEADIREWANRSWRDFDEELEYVHDFVQRAQAFVSALVDDGRGLVYQIG